MTTPTGPITLSSVQTEFGGANPIAMSEYYKGGAYVSSSVVDGGYGTPSTSGAITMGSMRNLQKIAVQAFSAALTSTSTATGIRGANLFLNSNGTSSVSRSGTGGTGALSCGPWLAPTTTGIGSSFWAKFVPGTNTGTTITGTINSPVSLAAGTSWGIQNSSTTVEGQGSAGVIYIYSDSGGTNLVGSGTVTWDVGYTP